MMKSKIIGQILIEMGVVNESQVMSALDLQKRGGGRIGRILIDQGVIAERDLVKALKTQLDLPAVDLEQIQPEASAISLLKAEEAYDFFVVPMAIREKDGVNYLLLAMADPTAEDTVQRIEAVTGTQVKRMIALESHIEILLKRSYGPLPLELQKGVFEEKTIQMKNWAEELDDEADERSELKEEAPRGEGVANLKQRLGRITLKRVPVSTDHAAPLIKALPREDEEADLFEGLMDDIHGITDRPMSEEFVALLMEGLEPLVGEDDPLPEEPLPSLDEGEFDFSAPEGKDEDVPSPPPLDEQEFDFTMPESKEYGAPKEASEEEEFNFLVFRGGEEIEQVSSTSSSEDIRKALLQTAEEIRMASKTVDGPDEKEGTPRAAPPPQRQDPPGDDALIEQELQAEEVDTDVDLTDIDRPRGSHADEDGVETEVDFSDVEVLIEAESHGPARTSDETDVDLSDMEVQIEPEEREMDLGELAEAERDSRLRSGLSFEGECQVVQFSVKGVVPIPPGEVIRPRRNLRLLWQIAGPLMANQRRQKASRRSIKAPPPKKPAPKASPVIILTPVMITENIDAPPGPPQQDKAPTMPPSPRGADRMAEADRVIEPLPPPEEVAYPHDIEIEEESLEEEAADPHSEILVIHEDSELDRQTLLSHPEADDGISLIGIEEAGEKVQESPPLPEEEHVILEDHPGEEAKASLSDASLLLDDLEGEIESGWPSPRMSRLTLFIARVLLERGDIDPAKLMEAVQGKLKPQ